MGSGITPLDENARTIGQGGGYTPSTATIVGPSGGPQSPLFPPYAGAAYTPGASLLAAGALIDAIAVIGGIAYYVKKNENGEVVEVGAPVEPADQTYDDNGQAAAPSDASYDNVESLRVQESNYRAKQERDAKAAEEAAAAGGASGTGGGAAPADAGSSGGGSSGGGSSSGGGGGAAPAASGFPFADGFGSTPNTYPTLPMTPIRAKILGNLSGAFPNAGRFPTPPGGWREDMAPMFTTGAFGGASAPAPDPAASAAPAPSQAPSGGMSMPAMPAMGGGIPGGPPPQSAPPLPDPTAAPPEAMLGLTPPQMAQGGMPPMAPSFSQPGFVAPGSPYDLQMQRVRPAGPGTAAPLPASLRQRFGL